MSNSAKRYNTCSAHIIARIIFTQHRLKASLIWTRFEMDIIVSSSLHRCSLSHGLLTLVCCLVTQRVRPIINLYVRWTCVLVQAFRLIHVEEREKYVTRAKGRLKMKTISCVEITFRNFRKTILYFINITWIFSILFN